MPWQVPVTVRSCLRILLPAIALALTATTAAAGESARLVYSRTDEAASCGNEQVLRRAVARASVTIHSWRHR